MHGLSAISLNVIQKTADLQLNFVIRQLDTAMAQFKLVNDPKSYKQFMVMQSELAREFGMHAVDYTRLAAAILTTTGHDLAALVDQRLQSPEVERSKPVVKTDRKVSGRKSGKRKV